MNHGDGRRQQASGLAIDAPSSSFASGAGTCDPDLASSSSSVELLSG